MWPFTPTHTPPVPDSLTQALLDQNRILLDLLRHLGVALPPRSIRLSGSLTKRTEADVIVVGRTRRVEIQTASTVKLPAYMQDPTLEGDPALLTAPAPSWPGSGKAVTGGFSATIAHSPVTPESPTNTPSPSPVPSTQP